MPHNINVFKNIFFQLKEWYKEELNYTDEDFNLYNDFSILKLIKLQFFISAVDSENNNDILNGYQFYAMPYGPVETNTYRLIKANQIDGININRNKTSVSENFQEIDHDINESISNAINLLKEKEPNLITAGAGELVDLSHKWQSWKRNYAFARAQMIYSSPIDNNEIVNDIKVFNLNLL
jgi:uncharacterized phage-associated protein